VLPSREIQDYSPRKKDIWLGYRLEGGQEWAVKDACHTVDNKSRAKFNEWLFLIVSI